MQSPPQLNYTLINENKSSGSLHKVRAGGLLGYREQAGGDEELVRVGDVDVGGGEEEEEGKLLEKKESCWRRKLLVLSPTAYSRHCC